MSVVSKKPGWQRVDKPVLHLLLLLPFLELVYQVFMLVQGMPNRLGADPGKVILEHLATVGIWILLATLAVTPLRKIFGWRVLQRYRRMLGLYAFFYISLHLLSYLMFILAWDWPALAEDVTKRPYMVVGMLAWVMLVLLAATSFNKAIRWMGRNWARLHKLVYAIAILAVVHEWWQAKEALGEPALHGVVLALLLGYRLFENLKKRVGVQNKKVRATA